MAEQLDDDSKELINVTDDGLVKKRIIKSNENGQKVSEHVLGTVWINIKGTTANGTVFQDELFEEIDLCLGKAQCSKGIDQALVTMKHGEHAIIEIYDVDKYGYSSNKSPSKYPANNEDSYALPVKYELIVIDSLPKQEESQNMTFLEQLNYANLLRERGNLRYEKERFQTALKLYERAIQCLNAMKDLGMAMPEDMEHTKVNQNDVMECKKKCFLNCSICHRRLEQHNECIAWSTKALEIDNDCKKGLIRRALSYYNLGSYDLAKKDMLKFQELALDNEKESKMIRKYLNRLQIKKQKEAEKQKKIYGGFLDKKGKGKEFTLYDDKKIDGDNDGNDDGFLWRMVMAIPNGIMYVVNECTKYCRHKDKEQ